MKTAERRLEWGFQLPQMIDSPKLDKNACGGRFPDCRYYPFYLANGRDVTLINISGSGDGHWERAPYGADVLSKLHSTGWFKADRRIYRPECGVYGPLICLGEFTACPTMRDDFVVPSEVRQYFDPQSATLTTFYTQRDHSTSQTMELQIETSLTSEGILIQEIEVLAAPDCGVMYVFSLGTVSPSYQNHMVPLAPPDSCTMEAGATDDEVLMTSTWGALKVHAFSMVGGVQMQKGQEKVIPRLGFKEYEQKTESLKAGTRFWRVVSFHDNREGGDPREACDTLLQELRKNGIRFFRERHLIEWKEYFAKSKVEVPDQAAQFIYDLSRYVIKANHHPGGFQPCGMLPFQWQGTMFWDAAITMESFLSCGNEREAREICGHIERLLPEARALAARIGNGGARVEWTTNLDTLTVYDPPGRQFHNNAVWARAFCVLNSYLADTTDAAVGPAQELLQFMLEEFERHGASGNLEDAFIGIDESASHPKPFDTWTCCVLLKALEEYTALCGRLNVDRRLPQVDRMMEKLRDIMEKNVDEAGVLQSFRGGKVPHWGSLVFDMFPDHPAATPTLAAMSHNYDRERDIFNFHGLNRYAERAFPWATYWASQCMARAGRSEALSYFLHNLNHINYFGGIPERIFYHGENYIEWFPSAHSALILTLNTILASEVRGRIRLLGGIDLQLWSSLSFENLHVGNGWAVSFSMRERKVRRCLVQNLAAVPRELIVEIPSLSLEWRQMAQPGINIIEQHS